MKRKRFALLCWLVLLMLLAACSSGGQPAAPTATPTPRQIVFM